MLNVCHCLIRGEALDKALIRVGPQSTGSEVMRVRSGLALFLLSVFSIPSKGTSSLLGSSAGVRGAQVQIRSELGCNLG